MITHDVVQGSPEWDALRFKFDCASEAPVIMGASPHMTRADLVRMKATGDERTFSDFVREKVLDAGHSVEPKARAVVSTATGDDFYPVVGSCGRFLASFDGLNMLEDTGLEVKLLNAALLAYFEAGDFDALDPLYYWQMEHQLLVSDAGCILFCVSDGTDENTVWHPYLSVPERREALIAAWDQFNKDVAAYKHDDIKVKPAAAVIRALPALAVQVEGKVLRSNLPALRSEAAAFIAQIKTTLETDEDFSNAENQVKFLKSGEENWEVTKAAVQAQMADVDALFRAGDEIAATFRSKRLELAKIVDAEKIRRRAEILTAGKQALAEHCRALSERVAPITIESGRDNLFAEAVKGKKNIDSIKAAVAQCLADAKIAANAQADLFDKNLRATSAMREDYPFLFGDLQGLMRCEPESCLAIAEKRVADYLAKQRAAAEAAAEAEREKIRAEERRKLEAEQARLQEEVRKENQRIEAEERRALQAEQMRQEKARQEEAPKVGAVDAGMTKIETRKEGEKNLSTKVYASSTRVVKNPGINPHRVQLHDLLDSGREFTVRNVSATQFVVTLL